ncbi:MAG TPA: DMT family transporter [Aeromicrobium sp.]|nr:DMT family transporter [Aeromicrobium sp.]
MKIPAPAYPLIAVLSWGAMFPIAAHALRHVDPFNITAIRYLAASAILLAVLGVVEGRSALSCDGQGLRLFALGSLGFAGFNLLAYVALLWSPPQDVAVIVPTMPLVTALVRWARYGQRPTRVMLAASLVALAGAALVVTKGDFTTLKGGLGSLLTLIAVACWVTYTMDASRFPQMSPLRYTALTAALGTITIVVATVVADLAGWQVLPRVADVADAWWEIAFLVTFGAVIAVLAWNVGTRRLGANNTALFIVLVPVVAFAIRIAGGYQPVMAELIGALVVIGALVYANLAGRREASPRHAVEHMFDSSR